MHRLCRHLSELQLNRGGEASLATLVPNLTAVSAEDGLTVRPAETADEPFIKHVFKTVRAESFAAAQLPPAALDMLLEQQFRAQSAGYAAQFPDATSFIVAREGDPVGRLLLQIAAQHWRIVDIAILPAERGRGLATEIINGVARDASEQGARELRLMVLASNVRARRLYAKLGFVDTSPTAASAHIAMTKWLDG